YLFVSDWSYRLSYRCTYGSTTLAPLCFGPPRHMKSGATFDTDRTAPSRHTGHTRWPIYHTPLTSFYNYLLLPRTGYPMKSIECKPQQLTAIGNRLLDWFSVIMADSKKRRQHQQQKNKVHFPAACKLEARWMFGHLDLNNDGELSSQELYDLEHDQNERCIKPFIDTCDLDQDNTIDPREWCRCFEKTDRPCAAVRRRLGTDLNGSGYAPDCDSQGFYKPTQCHQAVGVCWCVDEHGVEFANTRTRGKPNCGINYKLFNPKVPEIRHEFKTYNHTFFPLFCSILDEIINNANTLNTDDEDAEDSEDDDDSQEGSADRLLVF
ncbi:AAEL013333-PA, partial [Aedes aegypti]